MNVLALDGALGGFSAAVACEYRVAAGVRETGNVALERGLVLVQSVLGEAGVPAERLDRLAVGIGPGGFTGLRIAIAYAKALAAAWKLPLVPISSFDLLEYGGSFERVLTVVAGRPGVISARYRYGDKIGRASGRIAEVLDELLPRSACPPQTGRAALDVVGASKDVRDALAERGYPVRFVDPAVTPAAAAVALAAGSCAPAASLHEVRADYGELPAAKAPKL
ncbi:MAG: tRNA (adenosine(37)-N6)-threonylcarbamoyltransferase complex dimerization subunit type 1 TsaB [Candidatus Cybelea sp.]